MRLILSTALTVVVAVVAVGTSSAASELTLRVTSPPHFAPAGGSCPGSRVSDTVQGVDGAELGELDGCFQTFELFGDGSDSFTATYTFDLRGGRIFTRVVGDETPTSTGLEMVVTGTVTGGTGLYEGATGAIHGGGRVVFGSVIEPDLTFGVSLSS
jgi:hypothetical protein